MFYNRDTRFNFYLFPTPDHSYIAFSIVYSRDESHHQGMTGTMEKSKQKSYSRKLEYLCPAWIMALLYFPVSNISS